MNVTKGLFIAGSTFPGARVCLSQPHEALMGAAQRQAQYQATMNRMGHQLWRTRVIEMRWRVGAYAFQEICAETWPYQENNSPIELGRSFFSTWKKSPNHWKIVTKTHRYFGYGVAKSTAGVWYATIIVAD